MAVDKLAILINANGSQAISEFKKVGAAAGSELGRAEGKAAAFGATATKVGLGMMAAGGIIAAGLAKAGSAAQSYAMEVGKLQRLTGGTARDMSTLAHAAQQTSVPVEDLSKALGIASKNIVSGKWDKLGIDTRNAAGEIAPMTELLGDLADKLQGMSNGAEKNDLVLQTLGRNGMALMPMLQQGRAGFANWSAEVEKFGLVMDDAGIKKARELKAAQQDQDAAWKGLTVTLGQSVIPMMTTLTNASTSVATGFAGLNTATGGAATTVAAYASAALLAAGALSTTVGIGTKLVTNLKSISVAGAGATLGVAAVAAALAIYAQEQKIASDAADEMNATLRKSLSTKDAAGTIEQLGRVREQVQGLNEELAGSSNWAIWDKDFRDQLTDTRNKIGMTALAAEYALMVDMKAAAQKGVSLEVYRHEKKVLDDAAKAKADGVAPTEELAGAYKELGDAVEKATGRQKEYMGLITSDEDAQIEWERKLRSVAEAFKENGSQLDWNTNQMNIHTEAGAKNWESLTATRDQMVKMSQDAAILAGDTQVGTDKFTEMSEALRARLLPMMGYNKQAVDNLMGSLGLTAKDWLVTVSTSGLDTAIAKTRELMGLYARYANEAGAMAQMSPEDMRAALDAQIAAMGGGAAVVNNGPLTGNGQASIARGVAGGGDASTARGVSIGQLIVTSADTEDGIRKTEKRLLQMAEARF